VNRVIRLFFILCVAALPAAAECIDEGHYTLSTSRFPYTEDLAHPGSRPISSDITIAAGDDWTLIQTACAGYTNLNASTDVHVALRGSLRIDSTTAAADAMFEVQFRVDGVAARTHIRRVGAHHPTSYRFANVIDASAGNHLVTMWLRLRDAGAIHVSLQWITAMGASRTYPGGRAETAVAALTTEWTRVGNAQPVDGGRQPADASLQASFDVSNAAAPLMFAWTVDDDLPGEQSVVIAAPQSLPDGVTIFDHCKLPPSSHFVQLWARTLEGTAGIAEIDAGFVAFPHSATMLQIPPMVEASAADTRIVTVAGDAKQPVAMSPICGSWTKLLEFDVPATTSKSYSWTMDGFVEIVSHEASGFGQIGVEIATGNEATDVGMFEFQAADSRDGVSFYGDCSTWGNIGGTHVSLWIRRIEDCGVGPYGGGFVVGRRWLAVKLLPASVPYVDRP
jgi:hypothetical protein